MTTAMEIKTVKIEIFDPPMCCQGGLCGPAVDPTLLDINEAILKINRDYSGKVKVERYLLSQQGPRFMQNPKVFSLLKAQGVNVLPVTVVNGKIVKQKEYPSHEELVEFIGEQINE